MPNDAKLGLVVGVGLVIGVAVLFFRKDPGTAEPPEVAVVATAEAEASPPAATRRIVRPAKATPASRSVDERLLVNKNEE